MRTFQDGGERYDQLLGGDGNLISELNDLSLDLFSVRLERLGARAFDARVVHLLAQQPARGARQPGRQRQSDRDDRPRAGADDGPRPAGRRSRRQLSPRHALTFGGDVYFEGLTSESFNVNPVTGAVSPRRPRVPDGATFTQGGVFAQTDVRRDARSRCASSARCASAARSYEAQAPRTARSSSGAPLWPDDSLTVAT